MQFGGSAMKDIGIQQRMDLYVQTLENCGTYLLDADEERVGYSLFEEFDIGAVSFLHESSVAVLQEAGLISQEVAEKSMKLRELMLELQHANEWRMDEVKRSGKWRTLLELADEIKLLLGRQL